MIINIIALQTYLNINFNRYVFIIPELKTNTMFYKKYLNRKDRRKKG